MKRALLTARALVSRALLACAALLASACFVEAEPPRRTVVVEEPPVLQPTAQVTAQKIATGQTIASDPGKGVGVFVEYRAGGDWYVWTTCDSALQAGDCRYDLYLTPESGAAARTTTQSPPDSSGTNNVALVGGRVEVHQRTSFEVDGVVVHVDPPGAGLQIEAWLDGAADPRLLYWIGPDVLHTGSPSNPTLFLPTAP